MYTSCMYLLIFCVIVVHIHGTIEIVDVIVIGAGKNRYR